METKSRLEFVDIAKGIGIMIVCFGHSGAEDVVISWIGGFIVPLFFILSGYMYKDKGIPVGKDLYNKGKKLLKPYLFFSVVLFPILSLHLPCTRQYLFHEGNQFAHVVLNSNVCHVSVVLYHHEKREIYKMDSLVVFADNVGMYVLANPLTLEPGCRFHYGHLYVYRCVVS